MAEADNAELATAAKKYWSAEGYSDGGVIRVTANGLQSAVTASDVFTFVVPPPAVGLVQHPAAKKAEGGADERAVGGDELARLEGGQ